MIKRVCLFSLLLFAAGYAQESGWDTLNIKYNLLQTNYSSDRNTVKIKVPPYLTTREVMEQIYLAVRILGGAEVSKQTTVYVFKDHDRVGDRSKTGGVYVPGKGFEWDLREWKPDTTIRNFTPRLIDRMIYEALMDSMFADGIEPLAFEDRNNPTKKKVAREFEISVAQLDSIYYRVKWWWELNKDAASKGAPSPR